VDIRARTALLGGISPQDFMRRYWQRRPLLVRAAVPAVPPPIDRAGLFALAACDDVRSRLVARDGRNWILRHGPLPRRSFPPLSTRRWTLLVQGVDVRVQAAHDLLCRFRFVGDARLDDLMVSWASDGGGVGPHVDSYDVFLLQVQGRRRWRIGPVVDPALQPGLPLKVLKRFVPQDDWILEPGDMLYLPPGWAHDGVAVGECMTCSIGFRAPHESETAQALFGRLADELDEPAMRRFRDPGEVATSHPARVPPKLAAFAAVALRRALEAPGALPTVLGEWLSEPDPGARFASGPAGDAGWQLDRATRMLYDARRVFVNGEAFVASGVDASLLRRLADKRRLAPREIRRLSAEARAVLDDWADAGWIHQGADEE
jgi:50S ribosomal protein L16 3-hydroxylase